VFLIELKGGFACMISSGRSGIFIRGGGFLFNDGEWIIAIGVNVIYQKGLDQ
jgi:hypothetical protein